MAKWLVKTIFQGLYPLFLVLAVTEGLVMI